MDKRTLGIAGFGGVALMTATVFAAAPKWAAKSSTIENCACVAAKGKNDCGANDHSGTPSAQCMPLLSRVDAGVR